MGDVDRRTFLRTLALSPLALVRSVREEPTTAPDALVTVHGGGIVSGVTVTNCRFEVEGSAQLDAIHFRRTDGQEV